MSERLSWSAAEAAFRASTLQAEALLTTGALQTAIFNSANFSSIATDAQGVIQIFNVGAERMLGYTAAEVTNTITPADISDPVEVIARAAALSAELGTTIAPGFEALVFKASRGIEDIYELTYLCKDGSRLPAVVSVTALRDARDEIIGYLLIGTDNTARKQVEEERQRLDQVLRLQNIALEQAKSLAEKANLAKSDFLSSMSHELRSPLNAIIGFAQLMESDRPAPSASQLGSIEQILQAGWYLLELINEILDLALIESGRLTPSMEPVSLREVLLECQDLVMPQATKHAIALGFPALHDCVFVVRADRTRLKQVLINLLTNGIKYNRPAGKVTVHCAAQSEGRVRVTVTDTGDGLSEDQMAQLFQSFNRLGRELGSEQGTGIGLVVSKRLVEMMKGVIGVTSTLGVGSSFWIELPVTTEPDASDAVAALEAANAPALAAGERVHTLLYVEDNPANLKLIEQVIARRPDMRMLQAGDALRGIEIARTERPDVILMDINLPGMSGLEALRVLARESATSRIPIIALSANAMPRDVARGLAAGFFRYLTKPVRIPEFLETLDAALALAVERQEATPVQRGFA